MRRIQIVAEIGCNHNGNPDIARQMIREAKDCGADAVKMQSFHAASLISRYAPKAEYQKAATGTQESQLEMVRRLELAPDDFLKLRDYAEGLGLTFFSTPFDLESIAFLHEHGQSIWKIPSGEITNLPYLEKIGALDCPNKEIIVSTGMATMREIEQCIAALRNAGAGDEQITVLHCNTEYPTPDCDVNLFAIRDLKKHFPGMAIGFSDHSAGYVAAVGAAMLGVSMIEKHFTLDKNMPGPDHKASAAPDELRQLIDGVRRIEAMAGSGQKQVTDSERKNKLAARKSIVAKREIKRGELFNESNLACKRPGNGISPMRWHDVLGKAAERDFAYDELIEIEGFQTQEAST